MKHRFLFLLTPLALCLPLTSGFIAFRRTALDAYAASGYSNSKLTTTIDLNPVEESDIRSYYADLDGRNLKGEDLLKALKPILMDGQLYHSYDSGNSVWQAYEITDRDWDLSPASSTTYGTYDAKTNTITGYQYGSTKDNKNNPYQHLFYRNRGVEKAKWKAWDHHGDNKGTDREHIWPKGHGFGESGSEGKVPGARGDLHHLVASDSYVNSSSHNYYSYGFVDPAKIDDDAGKNFLIDGVTVVDGNYRGTSQTLGSGIVFEPQDCDKGDIARACFYMVARYNNLAGDDPNIDSGNPNLTLIDSVSPKETTISTASTPTGYGLLSDLLAWHKLDPVDEYEIHRNDLIYRNYDKNRNPFIDFPDWVDAIWGTVTLDEDGRTILSRDATPKGKASPASDVVYNTGEVPPETSSSVSSSETTSSSEATTSQGTSPSEATTSEQPSSSEATSSAPVASSSATSSQSSSSGSQGDKGVLTTPIIIAIVVGAAVVVLVIVVILIAKGNKKTKKAAKKVVKKAVKKAGKSSSKKKK